MAELVTMGLIAVFGVMSIVFRFILDRNPPRWVGASAGVIFCVLGLAIIVAIMVDFFCTFGVFQEALLNQSAQGR